MYCKASKNDFNKEVISVVEKCDKQLFYKFFPNLFYINCFNKMSSMMQSLQ